MSTYKVVGGTRFQGHAPGEVFVADFTEDQERRYIERGAIELADGDEPTVETAEVVDDPDGNETDQGTGDGDPPFEPFDGGKE